MHPELREQFAMVNCLRITKWQIVHKISQKVNCLQNFFIILIGQQIEYLSIVYILNCFYIVSDAHAFEGFRL